MRISDWSSDVCSSDLPHVNVPGRRRELGDVALPGHLYQAVRDHIEPRRLLGMSVEIGAPRYLGVSVEIGRASCRERGCQSVLFTWVAVSLKKKANKTHND